MPRSQKFTQLIEKIDNISAIIGIVGLGYVGLPLVIRFNEIGFKVVGFDIDPNKVKMLNEGSSYLRHIPSAPIAKHIESGLFLPTTDFSEIQHVDAIIFCVPTPLTDHRDPDLSYVVSSMETVLPHLVKGQVISLESTTYPGTTDEVIKPYLDNAGFTVGEDFFLVYSPEREDPGNPDFTTHTIPKVCGGTTPNCLEVGKALYGKIIDSVVPVSSTKSAEMTKLLENIYRSINIGLVNELKIVADRMGIDIWEVISAAATKPFGFTPFYPGPGLGGHCIPIDPFYLTWKAREYGVNTRFIELAGQINTHMPEWVVGKISEALNEAGKPVKNSKVLILGIAYKKNVDDMRESPSVELMQLLSEKGAVVSYADPYVPVFPKMRRYAFDLTTVEVTPEILSKTDCVVVATNHDIFDYEMIAENSPLIVDTRGAYQKPLPNVFKA